ncbi:MAG: dephospho-CoA kinase [Clostridia bacterium]|nr:dephospho-CoA kinase [Clostridia bacterium]
MKERPYVIGVTGNTGAGKSTAAHALSLAGVKVLDADKIARALQQPGQPALQHIVNTFGEEMLFPDGSLNRKKLGARVFADKDELEKLNSIMWPAILKEISGQIAQSEADIVIDAALLYETGMQVLCNESWVVTAPEHLRCQRIMRRDGIPLARARDRMNSQMPQEEKARMADNVLDGGGTAEELQQQALSLYRAARGNRA